MLKRLLLSVLLILLVALGTVALWKSLRESNIEQVARIIEAESYTARSQLTRSSEALHSALQNVRVYWSAYAAMPRSEWASDTGIEPDILRGVALLVWDDPARDVRFAKTPDIPVFDYRPDDSVWAQYEWLIRGLRNATQSSVVGPRYRENGSIYYVIYLVDAEHESDGRMAAVVNTEEVLANLLADESPGYAIEVFAGDTLLYERGVPAAHMPAAWRHEGMIRTSLGNLLKVAHSPTEELSKSFQSQSIDMILLLGLLISVLVGTLTFENSRARSRAREAERAERQLAELNRSLEDNVAERTRQLQNRTSDLQTLTDSVAHDLRNPLNAISINAQLLEEHSGAALGAEGLQILRRLEPSVHQMTDILDRLLGLSEVTHSAFKRERVAMQELVEETVDDLTVYAAPPPVDVQVDKLPDTFADRKLVHMLITNLVSNSIKYTRYNSQRHIHIGVTDDDFEQVYFVRDNGVGFDQAHADRLFEAFNRLGDASSAEGVGLGLTIATRAVERHGGRIWAEGEEGKGATFYFTLAPREDA